jgi:hypothetical protein
VRVEAHNADDAKAMVASRGQVVGQARLAEIREGHTPKRRSTLFYVGYGILYGVLLIVAIVGGLVVIKLLMRG